MRSGISSNDGPANLFKEIKTKNTLAVAALLDKSQVSPNKAMFYAAEAVDAAEIILLLRESTDESIDLTHCSEQALKHKHYASFRALRELPLFRVGNFSLEHKIRKADELFDALRFARFNPTTTPNIFDNYLLYADAILQQDLTELRIELNLSTRSIDDINFLIKLITARLTNPSFIMGQKDNERLQHLALDYPEAARLKIHSSRYQHIDKYWQRLANWLDHLERQISQISSTKKFLFFTEISTLPKNIKKLINELKKYNKYRKRDPWTTYCHVIDLLRKHLSKERSSSVSLFTELLDQGMDIHFYKNIRRRNRK